MLMQPTWIDEIRCPACGGRLRHSLDLVCKGCSRTYSGTENIFNLNLDPAADTALDLSEYESLKPPDTERRIQLFEIYNNIAKRYGAVDGSCLEIGSGTGNLTHGLVHLSGYSRIHCSDISARFLSRLRELVPQKSKKDVRYWMFDAGRLPFADGVMSAVFGHSVLHHLLNYEAVLGEARRVLRPGGIAVFGDPIMDNLGLVSLCAGIIWNLETSQKLAGLTPGEMGILSAIRGLAPNIASMMREQRESLAAREDKHHFLIGEMREISAISGFSKFEYQNGFETNHIGADHHHQFNTIMQRHGADLAKLRVYDWVFGEMTRSYGAAMGKYAPVNFGYFIFQK